MPEFDVAVIGAGIAGSGAAFALAAQGHKVVLIERATPASGPTGRSSALTHAFYLMPELSQLAIRGVEILRRLPEWTGEAEVHHQTGMLWVCGATAENAWLAAAERIRAEGSIIEALDIASLKARAPWLLTGGLTMGLWEPRYGYADAYRAANMLVTGARQRGAAVLLDTAVDGFVIRNGKVAGVVTGKHGVIAAPRVICAAGVTKSLIATLGCDLPIFVERHEIAVLEGEGRAREHLPFAWCDDTMCSYARPDGDRVILAGTWAGGGTGIRRDSRARPVQVSNPNIYQEDVDENESVSILECLLPRMPQLENLGVRPGYAGLYDMSPDDNPIVDHVPGAEGLVVVCGSSGHGFKMGAAIGEAAAQLTMTGASSLLKPFALMRFRIETRQLMVLANSIYARDTTAIAGLQKLRFFPLALEGGSGVHVIDETGRRLLDLSAAWGAASLGYGHPAIVDAVSAAVRNPAGASILSATHRGAVELAEALLATLPGFNDHKVWFGHSGSDANETAFRAIAAATGRKRMIAFRGAYHGGTAGSMAISGHAVQTHAVRADGLTLIGYPNPYRGDDGEAVIDDLKRQFQTTLPPHEVGALFIEPIQSDGGLIVPPKGFLRELTNLCRRQGILIVSDEVKVGLARSGRMHCFEHEGFTPDLICLGKGLGGGLPISAHIGPRHIMDHATAFAMQTLHGNPVSAAAAHAVLRTIARDDLAARAAKTGAFLQDGLRGLQERHPSIGDVRGRGLVIGVEMVSDRAAKAPSKMLAAKTVYRAFELGLVVYYVGQNSNVLELTPPLILTEADARSAIEILGAAIADVEAGRVSDDCVKDFAGW